MEDHYDLTPDVLGRGAFGEVRAAESRADGGLVAIKSVLAVAADGSGFSGFSELDAMVEAGSHPAILSVREAFAEGVPVERLHIVTDLAAGDLCDLLMQRRLPEASVAAAFRALLSGLRHLHKRGIVHRDVKLDNILYDDPDDLGAVRLGDFGLALTREARACAQQRATASDHCWWATGAAPVGGLVGSLQYMSPEAVRGGTGASRDDHTAAASPPVDIWGAGVVLFAALSGSFPFKDSDPAALADRVLRADYAFDHPGWAGVSGEAKDLVRLLLVSDPAERLTAREALTHPWFQLHAASSVKGARANGEGRWKQRKATPSLGNVVIRVLRAACASFGSRRERHSHTRGKLAAEGEQEGRKQECVADADEPSGRDPGSTPDALISATVS